MNFSKTALFTFCLSISACTSLYAEVTNSRNSTLSSQQNNTWFQQASNSIESKDKLARKTPALRGSAKNIILFVGDGMGVTTVTAARILDGQNKGMLGEENQLSFERFNHTGLSKTYNVDAQTPDSAGTMTALVTGVKTDIGIIGLAEGVSRGNCASKSGQSLLSILELAEMAGLSTGVVTTARVTHATPAATYAKSVDRNWESDSSIPFSELNKGCKDIASQLIGFNGIEVVLGGGRRNFLPRAPLSTKNAEKGSRNDGRNLINEWQKLHPKGRYVSDKHQLNSINAEKTSHVFGLFSQSHMRYESDRSNAEPNLVQMTQKAIEVLQRNSKGFFLMVEGARIDHAHHAGNAFNALNEVVELSKAVQAAVTMTNPEDTLIVVTADHSHVFTIAGYPKRGNPILGKVIAPGQSSPSLSMTGQPYTTLGYSNGLGFRDFGDETNAGAIKAFKPSTHGDLTHVDTTKPGYHQEVSILLESETHGAEDVAIYATGPGAHLVSGTVEQNQIFHIMEFAGDLIKKARKGF